MHKIGGKIRQLDHLTFVDLTVAVVYDKERGITDSARRLAMGDPDSPDIVFDASAQRDYRSPSGAEWTR